MRCTTGSMRLGIALLMITAMSTSGCANRASSETGIELRAACRALRPVMPDYSTRDTVETKEKGMRFALTFDAVCPRGEAKAPPAARAAGDTA
jgi:hypothetical protein